MLCIAVVFFSVTSKYSVDELIIYKLPELKKIQVMKNRHVENQENKILQCHALEQGNLMIIMNSKAQGDPIFAEHIATMQY